MQLDCEQLSEQDYSQAQDAYMEQIMSLQESLQAVESQHRHALLQIDAARKQNEEHLDQMQGEVI